MLNGVAPHPSERRDLYHRIRCFPNEVVSWRKRLIRHVEENPDIFPAAAGAGDQLSTLIDEGISFLREIARIVAVLHGTPNLGNKSDPTDELVYIILARKTRESAYQQTYDVLKRTFACWDDLIDSPRKKVEKLVFSGVLSEREFGNLGDLDSFPDLTIISAGGSHSSNKGGARSWTSERHGSRTRAILRMMSGR